VKNNIIIIITLILTLMLTNCTEKTSYSGKIFKKNEDIYKLTTKDEIIAILGPPNYIDPIEKKYIYYSEKKISKNFYNNKTVERILIVFHFNSENTIKLINEYNLDNQMDIKLVEDQTSNEIIKQGLLEKVFGGVGKGPVTNP
tara:strand:+ start:145 stop:573 length:429 start_codon:yes stop_codon:yes gene_type:complete